MSDEKKWQPYPAKRYHATQGERYVNSAEDEAALGPGWHDSPKKAAVAATKKVKE